MWRNFIAKKRLQFLTEFARIKMHQENLNKLVSEERCTNFVHFGVPAYFGFGLYDFA